MMNESVMYGGGINPMQNNMKSVERNSELMKPMREPQTDIKPRNKMDSIDFRQDQNQTHIQSSRNSIGVHSEATNRRK